MAKVPLNRRVNAYGQQPYYQQPQTGERYEDLHEGYIHPSQITKNGGALLNFVKSLAASVAQTEEDEAACHGINYKGYDRRNTHAIYHSKVPHLERVGQGMAAMLNEGERQREHAKQREQAATQVIQVPLHDLLNADKAFKNLTQGSRKPVYEQTFTTEEPKTMTDDDISMYLGGGSQKRTVPQQSTNNTFYVNMDKTTKALLGEQVKTNKLLGILVQTIREKFDELPQHLGEIIASSNLPDSEIMNDEQYEQMQEEAQGIDESLLP